MGPKQHSLQKLLNSAGNNSAGNIEILHSIPENQWPLIESFALTDISAEISFVVQPELPWFDGHFQNQPVLPGVAQIHWACLLSQGVFTIAGKFEKLTRLKFITPILPDQKLDLIMHFTAERQQVEYTYRHLNQNYSKGTICFSANSVPERKITT